MKKITILFAILQLCATAIVAQNKTLTSNDLMNGRLYPARVRSVQFVGKSNRFAFVRDNALYIGTSSSQKETLSLKQLSSA
ncbi:MAG: hypothetical protein IJP95_01775, partial [Bacteroidales bacterium]|nr:hypothetical protein [Bacteroidales bacterium]